MDCAGKRRTWRGRRASSGSPPRASSAATGSVAASKATASGPSWQAVVGARLGDRVNDWFTVHEPLRSAWIGYLEGTMAPGERSIARAVPASHHLLLAHGPAVQALRVTATGPIRVGVVVNLSPCEPPSDDPTDVAAARANGHTNHWGADPLYGRGYPADMVEVYGVAPPVQPGDLETIASPTDHCGQNYYFRQVVTNDPYGEIPHARMVAASGPRTAMGWEVHPERLAAGCGSTPLSNCG